MCGLCFAVFALAGQLLLPARAGAVVALAGKLLVRFTTARPVMRLRTVAPTFAPVVGLIPAFAPIHVRGSITATTVVVVFAVAFALRVPTANKTAPGIVPAFAISLAFAVGSIPAFAISLDFAAGIIPTFISAFIMLVKSLEPLSLARACGFS